MAAKAKTPSGTPAKRVYVSWSAEQRLRVFQFMAEAKTSPHSVPSLFRRKLQEAVEATKVPSRPWGNNAVALERKRFSEWLERSYKPMPSPAPVKFAVPVKANRGLEARVASAIRQAQSETLSQVREMLAEHRRAMQEMMVQSHDSLMKYWNPEYIGFEDSMKSAVDRISESVTAQLVSSPPEKQKSKKVLVVSNNERRLLPLEEKFEDCKFTFVNGENNRQVGSRGMYDIVICTRFVNHSTYDKLRELYPNKVHYANGSTSEVERVLRLHVGAQDSQDGRLRLA